MGSKVGSADSRLVSRVLRGQTEAFSELVRRHQGRTVAAASGLLCDPDAAQDIAQESLVEAYRGLGKLQDPDKFAAWLYGILRIRCRRYLSRRPPEALPWERDDVPEPQTAPHEPESVELAHLLSSLPHDDREILAARYAMDLSYAEIARLHGITAGNVRVRCFRARQASRELLASEEQRGAGAVAEGGEA